MDALFEQSSDVNNAFAIEGFTVADFVSEVATRASLGDRIDHLGSWTLSDFPPPSFAFSSTTNALEADQRV